MDFDELVALLCEDFRSLPSIIYEESCPRLFRVWKRLRKSKLDQLREDRLWGVIIAPLYQSAMSEKGAKQQADYRHSLTRSIRDPEEIRIEDEYNSEIAERRLKSIGVDVVKHS